MERTSPRAGDRDSNLEELLAACLERIESDGPQAVESFCREHPRHENELREWVAASYAWGVLAADRRQASHPERLGEYRLLANLGGGGMGVVYLAEQEPLARRVALKLIRPEYLLFPGAKDRFLREVHAIAQLKHPNIVPLYSFGEQSGLPYYAMEHIEGCSLAHVLHLCHGRTAAALRGEDFWGAIEAACGRSTVVPRASSLSGGRTWEETCLRVMQCVAEALEHAHARGVVHRDVKPSNIMITPEGRVLLLDFGLAYERGVSRMTRSGSQLGSLVYMSPEQLRGEASTIDERTDVYAFGVTLYELLALRAPFEGASSEVIAQRIIAGDSAPLRQLNRSLSWEVETVCATAMERDRSRRYASARQLAHDLENILERRPIAARRPGLLRRAWRWAERHPVSSVAMVFASLLLVSSAWFGLERSAAAARAESRRLIAESRAALAADTAQALLLGIAAARQHPSAEANSALMAALSDLNEVRTLVHGDHVVDVDFSNDGRLIVTAGQQRAILWQVPAGKQWRELLHPAAVRSARFSPGGELVVTVCADGSVRAWDLGSGSARVLAAACVAAFIADDARLVVWNTDGGAAVLAITDGAPLAVLPAAPRSSLKSAAAGQQPDARCVSAASARPLLAARAFGSRCQLWDVERGRAEWLDHPSPLTHLTFSSDGERLLTGCADSTVRLWSRAGGLLEQHRGPGSAVLAGAFSHDGRRFGFSCDDGGAFLHDQRSATRISLSGHEGSVSGVWFAPDDATVLTISGDHAARLWDAGTGAACAVLRGHRRSLLSARFSGDGNYLVTGSEDGTARLWRNPVAVGREETAAFEQLVRLPHWTRACQSARDNQASQRFNEQVWRVLGKHAPLAKLPRSTPPPAVAASADGRRAIAMLRGVAGALFDSATGERLVALDASAHQVAFAQDGRFLLACDEQLVVAESERGATLLTIPAPIGTTFVAGTFAPGGAAVLAPCRDAMVRLYDAADGRLLQALGPHPDMPYFADYSADGEHIVVAAGRLLVVWDARNGKQLRTLAGHDEGITAAAFSRDGRFLLSSAFDATARLWRWESAVEEYRLAACLALSIAPASDADFVAVLWNGRVLRLPIDPLAEALVRKPRELSADESAGLASR